jgi:hypothetical protein
MYHAALARVTSNLEAGPAILKAIRRECDLWGIRRWPTVRSVTNVTAALRGGGTLQPPPLSLEAASVGLKRSDFRALGALNHLHADTLAFLQCRQPSPLQCRRVDENVPAAVLRTDEAEPLIRIVPLYGARHLDGGAQIGCSPWLPRSRRLCAERLTLRRSWSGSALVNRQDLIDLAPLLPLSNPHLQGRAGADSLDAGRLQGIGVEEGVARSIRQFNEAEALFPVVPLHRGRDLGRTKSAARAREGEGGCVTRVVVIIEATAAGRSLTVVSWR